MSDYHVESARKEGLLEVYISGEGNLANVNKITDEVLRMVKDYKPEVMLVDIRGLKGRLGPVDTFFNARKYFFAGVRPPVAVADFRENIKFYSFHKTVASNVGFKIRYFNEIGLARAWLQSFSKK